jgi:hypothetical protein
MNDPYTNEYYSDEYDPNEEVDEDDLDDDEDEEEEEPQREYSDEFAIGYRFAIKMVYKKLTSEVKYQTLLSSGALNNNDIEVIIGDACSELMENIESYSQLNSLAHEYINDYVKKAAKKSQS